MALVTKKRNVRLGGFVIFALSLLYLLVIHISVDFYGVSEEGSAISVYFFNPSLGRLESEQRALPSGNYREIVQDLWTMLFLGPESAALSNVFPETLADGGPTDIRILQTTFEDRGVRQIEVLLSGEYLEIPAIEEIIFRSAVVWTFTELDWVSDVVFFVDDRPLSRLDGGIIGPMDRDNVLIRPQITMEHTVRKTVDLYFSNSTLTGLVAERRTIEVPSNLTEERVILQELIQGPITPGLLSLIPPDTVINDVYTESLTMTCYVDLGPAFDSRLTPGTPARTLAIFSIVNSLTSLEGGNINRVQFLINGERVPFRNIDADLSQIFELDEELIIHRMEMELM